MRSGLERSLEITSICKPTSSCTFFSTLCLKSGLLLIMIVFGVSLRVTVMVPRAAFAAALGIAKFFPDKKNTDTGGQGGEGDPAVEGPGADGTDEEEPTKYGTGVTGILIVVKVGSVELLLLLLLLEAPAREEPAIGCAPGFEITEELVCVMFCNVVVEGGLEEFAPNEAAACEGDIEGAVLSGPRPRVKLMTQ